MKFTSFAPFYERPACIFGGAFWPELLHFDRLSPDSPNRLRLEWTPYVLVCGPGSPETGCLGNRSWTDRLIKSASVPKVTLPLYVSNAGPIPNLALRHSLQEQYGSLMEDAVSNARKAAEMSARAQKPLILMARLLHERALLRDTPEQYTSDLHSAEDYLRQFLAARGNLDSREAREVRMNRQ